MVSGKLAVNRLRDRLPVGAAAVDRFVARHGAPIVEGERVTFLFRGEADEVRVRHRVVGLSDPLPMRQLPGTDLWAVTIGSPGAISTDGTVLHFGGTGMPGWIGLNLRERFRDHRLPTA